MAENDPKPITDGDIATPPVETAFTPAEPLKDQGVEYIPEGGAAEASIVDPAPASPTDQIKAGAQKLTGQAQDQVRTFADQGKERATGALDQLAQMLTDAAGQVDGKLGSQYGDYARQAAGQVQGLASQVRDKDVDELLEEARALIRRAPGVAIGVSAALGFAVARLVSSGLDQRDAA
jgi:uncharacterized protein YjbJ (UPF0337 family)